MGNSFVSRSINPVQITFDEDGKVEDVDDGNGYYPSLEDLKAIVDHIKSFTKKNNTQEKIDFLNWKLKVEHERAYEEMLEKERVRADERKKTQESMPPRDYPCYIYLIKDTIRDVYKVGRAGNVKQRFGQLKTANAGIELVAFYKGHESDEREIHHVYEFTGRRISGEWFKLDEEGLSFFHEWFDESKPFEV
jgi:hypothetical protein